MILKFIARQFRKPSGLPGRIWGRMMNRGNARMITGSINALKAKSDQRILEIGFGGGFGLQVLLDTVNRGTVTGIEISDVMISQNEKRLKKNLDEKRLMLISASVERLPLDDSIFDGVVTVNTIYFWSDVRQGISEIFRVLKPEGRLIIGIRPAESMRRLPFTRHGFRIYETDEIEKILDEAGFIIIHSETYQDGGLDYICIGAQKPNLRSQKLTACRHLESNYK